jgi:uncharacterized membrane protein
VNAILDSAQKSLLAGFAVALLILGLCIAFGEPDPIGLVSFLLRWIHVLGAILWVGMIFFVNFIQLAALQKADETGRATILSSIALPVAKSFLHASHLTVLSGLLLLVTTGYLFDRAVFASAVYVPPLRHLLVWGGAAGGLAMWAFVHLRIWPSLRIALGQTKADADGLARARQQIRMYARLNLIIAVPVTFAMVAAAHLY